MGSYTFKWDKPAEEVYVTGTFDNWTKTIKLNKEGDVFQKTVDLEAPAAGTKIYYKFVVDNQWVLSNSSPKEPDHEGNDNNFLTADDLKAPGVSAILNSVTPTSTTAQLAGEQPIEEKEPQATPSDVPGGFPTTPADELNKPIGINPLPAAPGAVNPITLAPGEKVPESITAQGIDEHVKLDKESYEKSDTLAGDISLPPVTSNLIPESSLPIGGESKDVTINTVGTGATTTELAGQVPREPKVPEVVKESQEKAGAEPEASAVAEEVKEKAQVEEELKEKVPKAPSTSEGTAGIGTEKSENQAGPFAAAAAAATAAGTAAIGAAIAAKDSFLGQAAPVVSQATTTATDSANKNLPDAVKEQLPVSVQETLATQNKEQTREEVSPEVPAEVKESITEAGKSPEAAANTQAVQEKKEVEAELLKEIKPIPAADEAKAEEPKAEPAVVASSVPAEVKESIAEAGRSPEAAANSEAVQEKKEVEAELLKEIKPVPAADEVKTEKPKLEEAKPEDVSSSVPTEVKESLVEANKSPEAAANTAAVEDKKVVEAELLKEVKLVPALAETGAETSKVEETKTEAPKVEEAKPETKTAAAEAPANGSTAAAANGANSANGSGAKAPEASTSTGTTKPTETASTTEKKKKHRLSSMFEKLKTKFSDKK